MIERINITKNKVSLNAARGNIIVKDNILDLPFFGDSYVSAIINWNTDPPILKKLVKFTNLGYIIDSNNPDSIANRPNIQKKFGNMDQIYDNKLQQVKVIQ